jgi:hypothetical protein|tara:strand:+ start:548 stop:736 length:189 start_codon:yes stop_codon:yes gene_type:complete
VRNKPLTKEIEVNKHKFKIEIYPTLVSWEIFPYDYNAALYAFSNKDKLNKIIEEEYVYEPKK